jgi:hypothetical protein
MVSRRYHCGSFNAPPKEAGELSPTGSPASFGWLVEKVSVCIFFHYVILMMLSNVFKGNKRKDGRESLIESEEELHLLSPSKKKENAH